MLGKIWTIASMALMDVVNNRPALISLILIPMILTFVVGQGETNAVVEEEPARWRIEVVNEDEGELGEQLLRYLESTGLLEMTVMETAVLQDLQERNSVAILVIPSNFTQSLRAGQVAPPDFYTESTTSGDSILVQQTIQTALLQLKGAIDSANISLQVANQLAPFADETQQQAYFDASLKEATTIWTASPPIDIQARQANQTGETINTVPTGFNQTSPGFLVMFSLFFTIAGGVAALVGEREGGTLQRLLVMPMHRVTIILGKFIGLYITSFLQVIVLIAGGAIFFNVAWAQQPIALMLIVSTFLFATTSMSLFLAAFIRTGEQANAVGILTIILMSALGGAWWPLEVVPPWMQTLGHLFPSAWAMDGFQDIITRSLGIEAIFLEAAVLIGFGLLFLPIGAWRFRYH